MAKAKKTNKSSLVTLINERNLMFVLAIILVVVTTALVFKQTIHKPNVINPVTIQSDGVETE